MPVLITAVVPGQTQDGYDESFKYLRPLIQQAPGFIAHGAGMSSEGWQVFEIWETQEQATAFFAEHVRPVLPPDVKPKRTYLDLHSFVMGIQPAA